MKVICIDDKLHSSLEEELKWEGIPLIRKGWSYTAKDVQIKDEELYISLSEIPHKRYNEDGIGFPLFWRLSRFEYSNIDLETLLLS